MTRFLTAIIRIFLVAYGLALLAYGAGIFGWFGQERDPMSGVFLVLLGWPWTRLIDYLPPNLWPWAVAAAPALNAMVLIFLKRVTKS